MSEGKVRSRAVVEPTKVEVVYWVLHGTTIERTEGTGGMIRGDQVETVREGVTVRPRTVVDFTKSRF